MKILKKHKLICSSLIIIILSLSACKKEEFITPQNESNYSRTTSETDKTTYYLDSQSNSESFQNLIDMAVAGDVIILRSGSHYVTTPIKLRKNKNSITIKGEPGAIIRKAPNLYNAAAFEISGDKNIISSIELDGGNLPEAGIIIYGRENLIYKSSIHNCGSEAARAAGILIHNTGTPQCKKNAVVNCEVYFNYNVGISQNGHSQGLIYRNNIYENGAEGITVDIQSNNNYIINNIIHQNNTGNRGVGGIGIDYSNGNLIRGNTIDYTSYKSGITFQNNIGGCDSTVIKNNKINFNSEYGILERWTQYPNTNTFLINNEFTGNVLGETQIIY